MQLTWLDSNSWLIEIAQQRILVDPWLYGPLVFGNLPWLFKGERLKDRPIPENIDLILLSQGLEDHAHPPTLAKLDRSIRVVGSPNAAKVAQQLGYSQVIPLNHGETYQLNEQVLIKAFPGSPIGPQLVENAYVVKNLLTLESVYYEPHGYHSPSLEEEDPVNIVITPIIDLTIPLLGAVIQGQKTALEVCKLLKPQVILPTAAGGEIVFQGLLMSLLKASGSAEQLQARLTGNNLNTQVIEAKPGEPVNLFSPV